MSKVIVVSEFVSRKDNSTGYFWNSLIKKLNKEAYEITVISLSEMEDIQGVNHIQLLRPKANKRNGFLGRLISQVIDSIKLTISIFKSASRNDLLITGTNPSLILVFLPFVKRVFGLRWVLLVHDILPENLVPAGILKSNGLTLRVLRKYFSFVYSSADILIVIGHDMKDLLVNRMGVEKNRVEVIQNWVDHSEITESTRAGNIVYEKLGIIRDDFVFTFFGNLGRLQGIDLILEATKHIKNKNIKILFIGDGFYKSKLQKFIETNGSKNVLYYGAIAQENKNQGLFAADVSLVTLASGMLGLGVPSKAYFSMAANKPILSIMDEKAEVSMMVNEHNIGWVYSGFNSEELAKCFDDIYLSRASHKYQSPRDVLINLYSEDIALTKFNKIIKETLANA